MPYWQTLNLDEKISAVLGEDEMRDNIASTGVPGELIAGRIDRDRIQERAAEAAARADSLEQRHASAEAEAQAARGRGVPWVIVAFSTAVVAFLGWRFVRAMIPGGFTGGVAALQDLAGSWFGLLFGLGLLASVAQRLQQALNKRREVAARARLGVETLATDHVEARKLADDAVNSEIRAQLRVLISDEKKPSYATVLPKIHAPGLSEVFRPQYEVDTDARKQLQRLLESMPGGSIGIAGPRGAGKTTLMSAFCGGAVQRLKDRRVLAVMIPAPVNYDAREFILHLFTKLCRQLRSMEGCIDLDSLASPFPLDHVLSGQRDDAGRRSSAAAAVAAGAGALFTALAVFLAWSGMTPAASVAWVATATAFMRGLGLSAGPLLAVGLTLFAAALVVVLARAQEAAPQQRGSEPDPSALATDAANKLRTLRFQQSFSSGWSGSLKLPVVEGGVSRAVQLAQTQISIPEIVDQFRKFVSDAAAGKGTEPYRVIIGIDELDKIGSDEKAHQFLNDIKAVFGIDDCFYLISVSESAMSSFERRGLPFRDAFDSAFDGVLYVDYLKLERSQELLRRRVIGLPQPFIALCHCLSGGLPRDLIRVCRELVGAAALVEPPVTLSEACAAVTGSDLSGKVRALGSAAQRLHDETQAVKFLEEMRPYEGGVEGADRLLIWSEQLWAAGTTQASVDPKITDPALVGARLQLMRLHVELSAYTYYLATMRQVFSAAMNGEKARSAEEHGRFDLLAKARQAFEVDPAIARSRISTVRGDFDLPSLPIDSTDVRATANL